VKAKVEVDMKAGWLFIKENCRHLLLNRIEGESDGLLLIGAHGSCAFLCVFFFFFADLFVLGILVWLLSLFAIMRRQFDGSMSACVCVNKLKMSDPH